MNGFEQAKKHLIVFNKPAVDFFEGALLGNGGLGAVVTTRPDAIAIHFGHNNVWDIRVSEKNQEKIGTFKEIMNKVKEISSEVDSLSENSWYTEYCQMASENYSKPYPSPMPCGTLLLGFDRREVEVLGHKIDISVGVCEVFLLIQQQKAVLQIFTEAENDRIWMKLVNPKGQIIASPFHRIKLIPDPERAKELPSAEIGYDPPNHTIAFRQLLPYEEQWGTMESAHLYDRSFRLTTRVSDVFKQEQKDIRYSGINTGAGDIIASFQSKTLEVEANLTGNSPFILCTQLEEGLAATLSGTNGNVPIPDLQSYELALERTKENYRTFWSRSAIAIEDDVLERTWYWNLYFFHCSVKAGVTCPGLFANWSYQSIGTAWHGDYHMNYNTQQPFWAAFSSNHIDKHFAYVDLVDHLLPVSKKWAKEYYGLRGAYYPHSAYPIEMKMMPYPVPTWGWEICETPWTVQSLWWHYLYTNDKEFLKTRAFVPIKEAVLFLVDYLKRPEAHGEKWGDNKYHIYPTVSPELYGLTPDFKMNYDCLVDLTLTKFVLKAFLVACDILKAEEKEQELIAEVYDVLECFPEYPIAESKHRGKVFVSVPEEDPEIVYNTPNSLMTVFPGEEHGLHSLEEDYQIAANSYFNHRNEGGNELVFYNLQGARLGLLDLERFKRQIEYCLMPNGTCADKVLMAGGRYNDTMPFDFMARMGIWFENFSLPAVINECLLQSYNGVLRFFPNWPLERKAQFSTLRAVGGFLVSAEIKHGEVQWIEVFSETGSSLKLYNPWESVKVSSSHSEGQVLEGSWIELMTAPGEILRFVNGQAC